jgi:lincosamide nucleotidyltransferase B/F
MGLIIIGRKVCAAAEHWEQELAMDRKQILIARLDDIGRSLQKAGHALALIGLGSVGNALERLDEYSDLDFFAIVEEGSKQKFIQNLDWLSSVCPVAYHFQNTPDGHKLLFADGVFCEFAVFEAAELRGIPFARGRIIWKQPQVDDSICMPARPSSAAMRDKDWLLGEALTNLYVGLCRFHRGEKLSAAHLIQHYAVDRVVELAELVEKEAPIGRDDFAQDRRFELRFPEVARELPRFMQGYERSCPSARAILDFLEKRFSVNAAMAQAIRDLCA